MDEAANPTISVIIPVFNDPEGIKACLDGLKNQTWPMQNLEVIVVDNDSRPALNLYQEYPFNLRVLTCPTPGSYAARNKGAQNARCDILAFTDADCIPAPKWLQKGARALGSDSANSLVGGEVNLLTPEPVTATARYQLLTGFQQAENILNKGFSATANLFCFRDHYSTVGPFEEKLLSGGDREWCWRANQCGYELKYAGDAIVHTAPRTTLSSAIRQARRVAAGRLHLKNNKLSFSNESQVEPHRNAMESVLWILRSSGLSIKQRIQILSIASIIKLATLIELVKLRLGSNPERR
ncbi:glycosyltransferase family 2 protein [Marinobacter sp. F4206]|uniref:glycosyltransferase n=1 Tax=Marinobacter sp. F4206 TaxID=2861777 RepID=UPI001C5F2807|nr:glycosyltransferase [Marinobacter sp. F4206]MBW4933808.1 glycosyltransferase [Marinobacter sp. F4206]